MSKLKSGDTDRKGEGAGESEGSRMITPQVAAPGPPPTRPTLAASASGHSLVVTSQHPPGQHHDMKSFKLSRPIAPAPSQQGPGIAARGAQTSQANIPTIIPPSLAQGNSEGLVSLNLVTTSASVSSGMGTVTHHPISVPVPPAQQTSVLHLGGATSHAQPQPQQLPSAPVAGATASAALSAINIVRSVAGSAGLPVMAPPQSAQQQTFSPGNFASQLPRGTTTLSVPKSTALLRQGAATSLQIPTPGLNAGINPMPLSLPRGPVLQTLKTNASQVARSQSPAVGAQPSPQAQPQDLSKANFPMHGSITSMASASLAPHPMHITLKGIGADAATLHTRPLPQQVQVSCDSPATSGSNSSSTVTHHRISVTLPSDPGVPQRLTPQDLVRSSLAFAGQAKVTANLPLQAKMMVSQPGSSQHVAAIKSVNLAVSSHVMVSSLNPCLATATTTIASSAPIPIAKVTPQRQFPVGNLPVTSASVLGAHQLPTPSSSSTSSSSSSSMTLQSSTQAHPPAPQSSLPSSAPQASQGFPSTAASSSAVISAVSTPSSSSSSSCSSQLSTQGGAVVRQNDQTAAPPMSSQGTAPNAPTPGAIIISSDFQSRPPGSVIAMSSVASSLQGAPVSIVTQAESRPAVLSHKDSPVWLPQLVYQQVPQNPLIPQSTPAIVGPVSNTYTFLPSQSKAVQPSNQSLSASHLAHAMSVASSSTGMRFNSSLMGVDHIRQQQQQQQHHHHQQQQQLSHHSSFSSGSAAISTTSGGDKTVLTPHEVVFNPSRTQASAGMYTASIGVQSQMSSGGQGLSSVPVSNPSSSPRPSILRKRNSEAAGIVVKKPIFNLNQDSRCHSPPRLDTSATNVSSPKTPAKNFSPTSENSQSSTDTALSSNDAHTPTHNHNDNDKVKADGMDCLENGPSLGIPLVNNIPASPAVSNAGSLSEASPRKRARKQSLHANEELKDNISSSDEEIDHRSRMEDSIKEKMSNKMEEKRGEYTDEDGVRWVMNKPRPTFVLIQPDNISTKTKSNHFHKYSDVKPKEERRPTVNELANQRGIMQKVNGWKLYFSASQLEELMEVEKDMQGQFCEVQRALSELPLHRMPDDEATKIHEMSQANIQRCQLIQNQLTEARANMIKTLEHKPRIQEIVSKHVSKRPIKKKERT